MKKILSGVAVAALLSSNVIADGNLGIGAYVLPFATVSIGQSIQDADLTGANRFLDSGVSLGMHVPSAFVPVSENVYARSNSDTATIYMTLGGGATLNGGNLADGHGNSIAMGYTYTPAGGAAASIPVDGTTPIALGTSSTTAPVGVFTATPTLAPAQPAGAYFTNIEVTVSAA